ncbi:MAG: hypothetical protein Q8N99_01040 [Nanoarchaeota archaeon]|nr:hypothetical protein [Nanoarchaeota archaeon]
MVIFKHYEIKFLKLGKISKHDTRVGSKIYSKSKIYLNDDKHLEKRYELYDVGDVCIEEAMSKAKGKGILIFMPDNLRKKEDVGIGKF